MRTFKDMMSALSVDQIEEVIRLLGSASDNLGAVVDITDDVEPLSEAMGQSFSDVQDLLNELEVTITGALSDKTEGMASGKPTPCTTYTNADHLIAFKAAEPEYWINAYLLNGQLVYGPTLHNSKPLADIYFQVDADGVGLDINADCVTWIGAVEYKPEEGVTK